MTDKQAYRRKRLPWFIGALVFATIYFFAGQRKVITIQQLDVHSGAIRIETRGYWGGITFEDRKPWREEDFKKLFPDETEPQWLPVGKTERRVLPDLSSGGRRRSLQEKPEYGNSSNTPFFVSLNLSQVLDAPHLSASVRRSIIYESFDSENPDKPSRNIHILDTLRQELLNATAFPEAERKEWQARLDRDDGGDITRFLKEAAKYPAAESAQESEK